MQATLCETVSLKKRSFGQEYCIFTSIPTHLNKRVIYNSFYIYIESFVNIFENILFCLSDFDIVRNNNYTLYNILLNIIAVCCHLDILQTCMTHILPYQALEHRMENNHCLNNRIMQIPFLIALHIKDCCYCFPQKNAERINFV